MSLTYLHYIYLAVIVVVIVLMILKHDVVVPCIVGLFLIGACYGGGFSLISGSQAVFKGMMVAGSDLFEIMLVIGTMVAMLKSLENMGADRMMIAPAAKLLKTPTTAFFVIAGIMYICATFFWPTPATALVGTILIPVALKAGLQPMMACIAMNLAGHGMALSGDLVLQGAPALSATASSADLQDVLLKGGILATITGVVAIVITVIKYRKDITTPYILSEEEKAAALEKEQQIQTAPHAKIFAILVPVIFFAILIRIVA